MQRPPNQPDPPDQPDQPDQRGRDLAFAESLVQGATEQSRALPLKREVAAFADRILGVLFPQLSDDTAVTVDDLVARLAHARIDLHKLVAPFVGSAEAQHVVDGFGAALPGVHESLLLDAEAILAGDPAAESLDEVVAAFPGFLATAIYRIARSVHLLAVPIIPRLMAEVAHTSAGIDIHPGATIGRSFCIDHGTGIVIGETAIIGDHVKLYQGVTLGALSVSKEAAGTKRHPTIGDRVVIYANASVLGGDTTIGDDSIIGGNVFLTSSVPSGSIVYQTNKYRVRRVRDGFEDADYVI